VPPWRSYLADWKRVAVFNHNALSAAPRGVMATQPLQSIELFFSYSHKDRELREELQRHLALLKRQGVITAWHDREIGAGTDWAGAIDAHLNAARIILLLVSADFLSSDYCYDVEMKRAMERHDAGEARVIPVLLRAVEWAGAPFSKLQAVPTGGVPVTSWENRDEAFAEVARAIGKAVGDLTSASVSSAAQKAESQPLTADRSAHYFPQQRQLIEELARTVIGRPYVEEALDEFVAARARGYFIVEGGPGQGKTSIAARLVSQRGFVHHFIGRTGRRGDPRLILSSLIVQLDVTADPGSLSTKTLEELGGLFEAALRRRAGESPVVVLFDALNELSTDETDDLPFLPDLLPLRAYVIVTTQPSERLRRLKEQLSALPVQVYPLGPLKTEEIRAVILSRQPDAPPSLVERIGRASLGNPLYLRAALDTLERSSDFDAETLPEAVDGYFRRATRGLTDNRLLRDVLGLLAVSRKSLSLLELSQITGSPQRSIHLDAIAPITPFLLELDDSYAFYHERFHDFVVRELLYEDELRSYHAQLASWLQGPIGKTRDYYWGSLAYHLFHAGNPQHVLEGIDAQFLAAKLRRFGYGVLEDLELLATALLDSGNPAFVELCVARLDGLREIVGGGAVVDELGRSVQPNQPVSGRSLGRPVVPRIAVVPGIDAYGVLLPKHDVTADFVEVVARNGRLVLAIGDAPLSGLKSAFVARFIATLFRSLVSSPGALQLGQVVGQLSFTISRHPYFERVSMQCVEVALDGGMITVASAGHPYPVLYSNRYGRCDRLPVRGPLLHAQLAAEMRPYHVRHAEIGTGDVLVLVSDGITEGGPLNEPYGYRFTSVIQSHAGSGAKKICEAILADWRAHLAGRPALDDATILVLAVTGGPSQAQPDGNR
jgi:Stage II sporulation protein E (SpoIIE)/TIR domain